MEHADIGISVAHLVAVNGATATGHGGEHGLTSSRRHHFSCLVIVIALPGLEGHQVMAPSSKGWIGVDFDGTLAEHSHGTGDMSLGKPIRPMVARVQRWLEQGHDVRIMTARACSLLSAEDRATQVLRVQTWCLTHIGRALPVTAEKNFHMWILFDDRARHVHANHGTIGWGETPVELR